MRACLRVRACLRAWVHACVRAYEVTDFRATRAWCYRVGVGLCWVALRALVALRCVTLFFFTAADTLKGQLAQIQEALRTELQSTRAATDQKLDSIMCVHALCDV